MDTKVFSGWIEDVAYACQEIQDAQLCEFCPMKATCIEDSAFSVIAFDTPRDNFEEIIKMGDNPKWYVMSDDARLEMAYRNR